MAVLSVLLAFSLSVFTGVTVVVGDMVTVGKNSQEGMVCGIHRGHGQEEKKAGFSCCSAVLGKTLKDWVCRGNKESREGLQTKSADTLREIFWQVWAVEEPVYVFFLKVWSEAS